MLRVEESKAAVHVSGPKCRGFTLPPDYPAGEEDAFGRRDAISRSGLAFYPGGNRVQMASCRHSFWPRQSSSAA